ncbi:MAG: hypothetical protein ACI35S_01990 [Anaeroplasma sp.]
MKKKVLFIILFVIICFNFINVDAATWKFEWFNTVVHVPVGSQIEDYRYKPYAVLYRDGQALTDSNISYLTEGDWLYFYKDIDSQTVGEYKVWYKAFENEKYCPGTCNGYKCLITFIVEDNIAPTISAINSVINIRRNSYNDNELLDKLKTNVICKDNYSECDIRLDYSIDISSIGRYKVDVTAVDESGNSTSIDFYVNIFEDRYPTINSSIEGNHLIVGLNDEIVLSKFFTAFDVVEGDLTNKIVYPNVYTSEEGIFEYRIYVENSASLISEYILFVEVVDDQVPSILLSTHQIFLDYKDNFDEYNFNKYILSITDNVEINYNNLLITHDLENKVGVYHIWYEYTDGIHTVSDIIEVRLISKEKPIIEVSDIVLNTNSNVNLMDYINVIDDSDSNIMQSVVIDDSNVDYEKEGVYYASVYALNSSGLSTTKRMKVIIEDKTSIDSLSLVFIISTVCLGIITVGYCIFFLYYFVIRKKIKNI